MRSFDEIVNTTVNQSALLFRNASTNRRRQAVRQRIEQIRGMIELSRQIENSELARRFEQHLEALKQTLKRD